MEQSGLKITPENEERVGVFIGSGIGGFEVIEREHTNLLPAARARSRPSSFPHDRQHGGGPGEHSLRRQGPDFGHGHGLRHLCQLHWRLFRMIQHGDADAMIAGGSEAAVTQLSVGGFAAMRALSTRNDDPQAASRPFDKDRDGFVLGEGAGILILEELEFAKARGAKILGEIIGYGMSADAYHMTGIAPEGAGRAAQHARGAARLGHCSEPWTT
jgi:3-oxoacyl-[acyl-carrier-protein] synthase II